MIDFLLCWTCMMVYQYFLQLVDSASVQMPNPEASTKDKSKIMVPVCTALVNAVWRPLLEAFTFILTRWYTCLLFDADLHKSRCRLCSVLVLCLLNDDNVVSIILADLSIRLQSEELNIFGCCQELFNCKDFLTLFGCSRTQGEVIVSEIFKGYQAFTKVSQSKLLCSLHWHSESCYACNFIFVGYVCWAKDNHVSRFSWRHKLHFDRRKGEGWMRHIKLQCFVIFSR